MEALEAGQEGLVVTGVTRAVVGAWARSSLVALEVEQVGMEVLAA